MPCGAKIASQPTPQATMYAPATVTHDPASSAGNALRYSANTGAAAHQNAAPQPTSRSGPGHAGTGGTPSDGWSRTSSRSSRLTTGGVVAAASTSVATASGNDSAAVSLVS